MKASTGLIVGGMVVSVAAPIIVVIAVVGGERGSPEDAVPERTAEGSAGRGAEALAPLPVDTAGLRNEEDCTGQTLEPSEWPIASGYRSGDSDDIGRGELFVWDVVQVNNGRHYDAQTGIFRAPVAGIYELCANLTVTNGIASARLRLDGAFIGPRRWYASPERRRYGRDCQVFTAQPGSEVALVVQSPQQRCEESYCNFTTRLLAPACPSS
jgi:hypothetical protein